VTMRVKPLVFAVALVLGACSTDDSCEAELISVTLPAMIVRDVVPSAETLTGEVSVGNVGAPVFEALRAVLVEDPAAATDAVIWTVPAFSPDEGWLAVAIAPPIATGDELTVGATLAGAGWGIFELPGAARLAAGLHAGNFSAASVTGGASVLGVAPLRLRLDLRGTDGAGAIVTLQGDASFAYRPGPPSCT
jgi:hypothetical protein